MDRYSIAIGKKPPPPQVIPESVKIYYLGVTIENGFWTAEICREKVDATIEIVTSIRRKFQYEDEIFKELTNLNKKYPIKLGIMDSPLLLSENLNFKLIDIGIKNFSLWTKINKFCDFWMNTPGVIYDRSSMSKALKLSFWALHQSLTKDIPDLYTNKDSFNKHKEQLHQLLGIKMPSQNDEIEFSDENEYFMAPLEMAPLETINVLGRQVE